MSASPPLALMMLWLAEKSVKRHLETLITPPAVDLRVAASCAQSASLMARVGPVTRSHLGKKIALPLLPCKHRARLLSLASSAG